MGRRQLFAVATAFVCLFVPGAFGQGSRKGGGGGHHHHAPGANHRAARDFRNGPQRMLHLSPEDRQTFQRNAERWLKMDAQQRQMLRDREVILRQRRKAEAEAFLRDSGLRLENGARAQFEQRYLQERRRIERSLSQEIEAKRQQELPQLKERLKSEFQVHQASPGVSSKPNN